jgi:hypothetical protein
MHESFGENIMKITLRSAIIAATTVIVGCGGSTRSDGDGPSRLVGPAAVGASSHAQSGPPDVGGTWTWNSHEQLTVPPFVAQLIFGIQPEGPVTRIRCDTTGTLTLSQSGATFAGSATQQAVCETGKGHVFVPPPAAVPPTMDVVEGRINGHSIEFVFTGGLLSCPYNGVITSFANGTATGLRATGRCIVPGDPRSPVPLDPPPAGTSKTLELTATRL